MTETQVVKETPDTDSILKSLDVAIALGAEIAAPVGSFFYECQYFDNSSSDDFCIGRFPSMEAAVTALVAWIIQEWANSDRTPWGEPGEDEQLKAIANSDDPEKTYLEIFTEAKIIDAYFEKTYDRYSMEKYYIDNTSSPLGKIS